MKQYSVESTTIVIISVSFAVAAVVGAILDLSIIQAPAVGVLLLGTTMSLVHRIAANQNLSWRAMVSVAVLCSVFMLGALFYNIALNTAGIERPLSEWYLLVPTLVVALGLIIQFVGGYEVTIPLPETRSTVSALFFTISIIAAIVVGSQRLRETGNPDILIISHLFIVIPLMLLWAGRDKDLGMVPIIIWLLSFALTLPHNLRSDFLAGGDTHLMYWFFKHTLAQSNWSVFNESALLSSTLSSNLLPVILTRLLGVDPMVVFKFVIPLMTVSTVFGVYHLSQRNLDKTGVYIATVFFLTAFAYNNPAKHHRAAIAIILFIAIIMCLLPPPSTANRIFVMIFAVSLPVSHYATTYIGVSLAVVLLSIWVIDRCLQSKQLDLKQIQIIPLLLVGPAAYLWYNFSSTKSLISPAIIFSKVAEAVLKGSDSGASATSDASGGILSLFGSGFSNFSTLEIVQLLISWTIFSLMLLGGVVLLFWGIRDIRNGVRREKPLLYMAGVAGALLIIFVVLNLFASTYSISRTYVLVASLIAPAVATALQFGLRQVRLPQLSGASIAVIVCIFVLAFAGPMGAATGQPTYGYDPGTGDDFHFFYFSNSEMAASSWIGEHRNSDQIYADKIWRRQKVKMGWTPPDTGYDRLRAGIRPLDPSQTHVSQSYVYLHHQNVERGVIFNQSRKEYVQFQSLPEFYKKNNVIYNSGDSIIMN